MGWLDSVKNLVTRNRSATDPIDGATRRDAVPKREPPKDTTPKAVQDSWVLALIRRSIPLLLCVVGLALTICSELIGLWGLLGYALLAASPIVYWLERIERRLAEIAAKMNSQ